MLFGTEDEMNRYCQLIQQEFDNQNSLINKKYKKEFEKSKNNTKIATKRKKNASKEAKEAEELASELGLKKQKTLKKNEKNVTETSDAALIAMIRGRAATKFDKTIADLESKYSKKKKK